MVQQPLVGQGLLTIEASLSNSVRLATLGRTPLQEWSARRRELYLTTHNNHKRQTSMPRAGFEPTFPTSGRQQTHTPDRAATGIGSLNSYRHSDNQNTQILLLSLCSHCLPYILKRNQGKFRMSYAHSTLWSLLQVSGYFGGKQTGPWLSICCAMVKCTVELNKVRKHSHLNSSLLMWFKKLQVEHWSNM